MAELVDAHVSGACVREDVGVRLPPAALFSKIKEHLALSVHGMCGLSYLGTGGKFDSPLPNFAREAGSAAHNSLFIPIEKYTSIRG